MERITGKRAANSVPAAFVKSADELVMVDVPADEVSRHSQRGSLQPEQLSQLRELALLFAAEEIPLTATGRPRRFQLAELAAARINR